MFCSKKKKKILFSHLMEYIGSNFCYSIVTKKIKNFTVLSRKLLYMRKNHVKFLEFCCDRI